MTVSNRTFAGNTASGYYGGAIFSEGVVTLSNVTFAGNTAAFGGAISKQGGQLTLTNVTISGNSATNQGGGIDLYSGASATLQNTIVAGDTVAAPVSSSTGQRSFCTTSDGVIRFKIVPPLEAVISASECTSWQLVR